VGLAVFLALGAVVSARPPLAPDRAIAQALFGYGPALAWRFTQTGLLAFLVPFCALLLGAAIALRAWRSRAILAVVSLAATHGLSDLSKEIFRRPRPEHWLLVHETSYGYPSGHAATAASFYALLALFVWRSGFPAGIRLALGGLLGVWAGGICWSRIALGAHYPSDVLGGLLLGSTVAVLGLASRKGKLLSL
jgi:undecaprenyl-diphosphatase